jgi:hypothetical protein
VATVIDHASDREANDRCKALNRRGQPCRANTLDDSGFCFAHRTDMRELGRKGGKASHAARRGNTDKHASVYLRERVQESPELIWRAFKSAIESNDPRISSRGASLLLSYLPAPDREERRSRPRPPKRAGGGTGKARAEARRLGDQAHPAGAR